MCIYTVNSHTRSANSLIMPTDETPPPLPPKVIFISSQLMYWYDVGCECIQMSKDWERRKDAVCFPLCSPKWGPTQRKSTPLTMSGWRNPRLCTHPPRSSGRPAGRISVRLLGRKPHGTQVRQKTDVFTLSLGDCVIQEPGATCVCVWHADPESHQVTDEPADLPPELPPKGIRRLRPPSKVRAAKRIFFKTLI